MDGPQLTTGLLAEYGPRHRKLRRRRRQIQCIRDPSSTAWRSC